MAFSPTGKVDFKVKLVKLIARSPTGKESFNKKKKKAIGIFTDSTVSLFNRFVDELNEMVERHLGKASEVELARAGLLDFEDFFDIKYDTDADGEVYPDVYSEIEAGAGGKKKKKPTPGGKPSPNEKTI